jgi:hypothetical protein
MFNFDHTFPLIQMAEPGDVFRLKVIVQGRLFMRDLAVVMFSVDNQTPPVRLPFEEDVENTAAGPIIHTRPEGMIIYFELEVLMSNMNDLCQKPWTLPVRFDLHLIRGGQSIASHSICSSLYLKCGINAVSFYVETPLLTSRNLPGSRLLELWRSGVRFQLNRYSYLFPARLSRFQWKIMVRKMVKFAHFFIICVIPIKPTASHSFTFYWSVNTTTLVPYTQNGASIVPLNTNSDANPYTFQPDQYDNNEIHYFNDPYDLARFQ